jgi:hypothetical protein
MKKPFNRTIFKTYLNKFYTIILNKSIKILLEFIFLTNLKADKAY